MDHTLQKSYCPDAWYAANDKYDQAPFNDGWAHINYADIVKYEETIAEQKVIIKRHEDSSFLMSTQCEETCAKLIKRINAKHKELCDLKTQHKICGHCDKTYTGYGNNSAPINCGRVCGNCNEFVLKARFAKLLETVSKTSKRDQSPSGT